LFLGEPSSLNQKLTNYAADVKEELAWIDTFVGLCYRSLPNFEAFLGMCGYYFVSAIGFERDVARDPMQWPRGYMLSKDVDLKNAAEKMWQQVSSGNSISLDQIRNSLAPWNDVGLVSKESRNRLAHTAASK
jgi:hypothetical protein